MVRQLIRLAALAAVLVGCAKRQEDAGGSADSGDPNATYTIKLREPQVGDKYQILRTGNRAYTSQKTVKGKPKSEESRGTWRYEYTDEILEIKNPKEKPTKVKHAYTAAERVVDGKKGSAAFQNKSVAIEKIGTSYQFRIEGGGRLAGEDLKYFTNQYNTKPRKRPEELIPDRAVRVGEVWGIDKGVLASVLKDDGFVVDDAKSTGTGTLTKTYTKDGKQFGVIELRIEVFPSEMGDSGQRRKLKPGSKLTFELRADACIDGSSSDSAVTNRILADLTLLNPAEEKIVIDESDTITGKQLK